MKAALFLLVSVCAGASVAVAQVTPTPVAPRLHSAPEIDPAAAGAAVILLVGAIAIIRGRRRG